MFNYLKISSANNKKCDLVIVFSAPRLGIFNYINARSKPEWNKRLFTKIISKGILNVLNENSFIQNDGLLIYV